MFGMTLAKRQTFLIDPDGNVAKHYVKVKPDTHAEEVMADLTALVAQASDQKQANVHESLVQGLDALVETGERQRIHPIVQQFARQLD